MEQFRQMGEVLGCIKALMVFRDEIKINQRQCCLLVDIFNLAFEGIAEEIKHNLKFQERLTKWKVLEQPLKEMKRIFKEGERYIRQCLGTKDLWARAISLAQNTDCVDLHLYNLLWCVPVVLEATEVAGQTSGCDEEDIQKKKIMLFKKYEREWMDPKLFQRKFGKQYLVSPEICNRIDGAWREDRWLLLEMIGEKRTMDSSLLTKQRSIVELLFKNLDGLEPSKGKLFPSSLLVSSNSYKLKRRLGNGRQYKEIEWMGQCFALRHFLGDIDPLMPEISLLSSIVHPNVMHFLCGFTDEEKKECFLVMELMSKDLCSFTKEICGPRTRFPFSLPVTVDIMLQIAKGMEYLHSRKICHGDLNTSNILVKPRSTSSNGYLHIKVTGFGLPSVKNGSTRTSTNQMTANQFIWYAPEVLLDQEQGETSCNNKYTEKADVYSFGMICFEILTGKVPFEDSHLQGDKVSRNIVAGERPLFPYLTPKYLTNLTKKCWQTEPAHRPNFSSICRILRYIKRFLVLNPDHSQPDPPAPLVDCCDLETSLSKEFASWGSTEMVRIAQIPFQMFAYRIIEKEKSLVNIKEKSYESGSDGSSFCGDESFTIPDDTFSVPIVRSQSLSHINDDSYRRTSTKKSVEGKVNKNTGRTVQNYKGRAVKPPQKTARAQNMRTSSERQLRPMPMNPSRRKGPGHASDSELA